MCNEYRPLTMEEIAVRREAVRQRVSKSSLEPKDKPPERNTGKKKNTQFFLAMD